MTQLTSISIAPSVVLPRTLNNHSVAGLLGGKSEGFGITVES